MDPIPTTIPARSGKAAWMKQGQSVKVINTHGEQVVDTWAFAAADLAEFMSMEHSRAGMLHITPRVGDTLLTNRRRPILTLTEDTAGNVHDTLMAACDRWRYEGLGCAEYHENCQDNLFQGFRELGLTPPEVPSPLNLFMNIPIGEDGSVSFQPPLSTPGSLVRLRAEMDLIVVFSACPQDLVPVNGANCIPQDAHYTID